MLHTWVTRSWAHACMRKHWRWMMFLEYACSMIDTTGKMMEK